MQNAAAASKQSLGASATGSAQVAPLSSGRSSLAVRDFALLAALLAVGEFFTYENVRFISPENLSNLAVELSITAVLALGMLLIIVAGHIDLSIGSGAGLIGGLAAVLISEHHWSPSLAMAIGIVVGVGVWMYMACPIIGQRASLPVAALVGAVIAIAMFFLIRFHLDPLSDAGRALPAGETLPVWGALWKALLIGVIAGGFLAMIRTGQQVPAFIITLAGLLVFRGLQWLIIHNSTIGVKIEARQNLYSALTNAHLSTLAGWIVGALAWAALLAGALVERKRRSAFGLALETREILFSRMFVGAQLIGLLVLICNLHMGVPFAAVVLAATAAMVWTLTQRTRFGRYLYAVGGNEEAAVISGIPVRRVVLMAFALMGLLVALGGFLQTAYLGYSTPTVGNLLELDAIAACVIGGTSLKGGRGTVLGVLFGALIMATLNNGMTLMAVSPEIKYIARGLVLAAAVWLDVRVGRG